MYVICIGVCNSDEKLETATVRYRDLLDNTLKKHSGEMDKTYNDCS